MENVFQRHPMIIHKINFPPNTRQFLKCLLFLDYSDIKEFLIRLQKRDLLMLVSSKIPPSIISSWAFPHRNRWSQVCSPQGFQPLFLSQHWPYFQYILLQVLQNHLATYERALIIPLVHVQPGFQVRRTKDDWQTFPKAMTKACKTWVFCSVWQYNNFSITLKKNPPISGVHSRDQS